MALIALLQVVVIERHRKLSTVMVTQTCLRAGPGVFDSHLTTKTHPVGGCGVKQWRKGRDSNPRGLLTLRDFQSRALGQTMRPFQMRTTSVPESRVAERVGFEPTRAINPTAFRERHLKPLGHLSATNSGSLKTKMQGDFAPCTSRGVRPAGLEPATFWSATKRSIH
jgi:hypothetical protein